MDTSTSNTNGSIRDMLKKGRDENQEEQIKTENENKMKQNLQGDYAEFEKKLQDIDKILKDYNNDRYQEFKDKQHCLEKQNTKRLENIKDDLKEIVEGSRTDVKDKIKKIEKEIRISEKIPDIGTEDKDSVQCALNDFEDQKKEYTDKEKAFKELLDQNKTTEENFKKVEEIVKKALQYGDGGDKYKMCYYLLEITEILVNTNIDKPVDLKKELEIKLEYLLESKEKLREQECDKDNMQAILNLKKKQLEEAKKNREADILAKIEEKSPSPEANRPPNNEQAA